MGQERFYSLWAIPMLVYFTSMLTVVSTTHAQTPVNEKILIKSLFVVPGVPLLAGIGTYSLPERTTIKGVNLPAITGGIYFWSTENGRLNHFVPFSREVWPAHFAISPDGTRVAVIFYDPLSKDKRPHGLGCYSLVGKKWLWKWKWLKDEIDGAPLTVRFLPDNRRILVLGLWSIWYYDAETGQKIHEWKGLLRDYEVWKYAVRTSYVSPSGRFLVIWQEKPFEGKARGGVNKYVAVWDLETGKEVARWEKPNYECQIATFSPDEQSVIFGCKDGYIREWSIRNRSMVRELRIKISEPKWVLSVVFSPDGKHLAVDAGTEAITMTDYAKQIEIHKFDRPGTGGYSSTVGKQYPMAFSSDGEYFVLWDKDRICLYVTSTWEQKWCVVPTPPDIPKDN